MARNETRPSSHTVRLRGKPSEKQKAFFDSRCKYTAYGGARGGGKSWALRRKLILMALRYAGLRALIIRRTYPELRENHLLPLLAELKGIAGYTDAQKCFTFPNQSRISLGYLACEKDVLQYQGQEYDVIAMDEATQFTEYQFQTLKACLRGVNTAPKRMYLTCNPGGIGHAWVKRLFVDRQFQGTERPEEYGFIAARVYDNAPLLQADPSYVAQLQSLPKTLRRAWLDGEWDLFEGQYFPEFSREKHVISPKVLPEGSRYFAAMDYGFDRLAVLWLAALPDGTYLVIRELCLSGLTLSEAAEQVAAHCRTEPVAYIAASPDLWNRRQDSGASGVEIMERTPDLPPLCRADDRRIIGWRTVREFLRCTAGTPPRLRIFSTCTELIRCLPALTFDRHRAEDVSDHPHAITHAPEALRYALMSVDGANSGMPVWESDAAYAEVQDWIYS